MVHPADIALLPRRGRTARSFLARHRIGGVIAISWLVVFVATALTAAWLGGAWTPAGKPAPAASWFADPPTAAAPRMAP